MRFNSALDSMEEAFNKAKCKAYEAQQALDAAQQEMKDCVDSYINAMVVHLNDNFKFKWVYLAGDKHIIYLVNHFERECSSFGNDSIALYYTRKLTITDNGVSDVPDVAYEQTRLGASTVVNSCRECHMPRVDVVPDETANNYINTVVQS